MIGVVLGAYVYMAAMTFAIGKDRFGGEYRATWALGCALWPILYLLVLTVRGIEWLLDLDG